MLKEYKACRSPWRIQFGEKNTVLGMFLKPLVLASCSAAALGWRSGNEVPPAFSFYIKYGFAFHELGIPFSFFLGNKKGGKIF